MNGMLCAAKRFHRKIVHSHQPYAPLNQVFRPVRYDGENIDIDIFVIIEFGTRINSVADSVANTVKFQVETALGMTVHEVNVHVAGLRVSSPD